MAAPAFDASSKGTAVNASSISWSHTTGSGSNRVLVVGTLINSNTVTVSGVTWNTSSNLTQVSTAINGSARVDLWYLVNPAASTTATIKVTLSAAAGVVAGAVSYTNASQSTNPFGTAANATGTGTAVSVTVNSTDATMMICNISGDQGGGSYSANSVTSRWTDASFANGGQGDKAGTATSTTVSWTLSASDSWVSLAAPLNVAVTVTNNQMSSTDALVAADAFLPADAFIPSEANTVQDASLNANGATLVEGNIIIDIPLATDSAGLVDSAPASDIGALQAWGIDALSAVDTIAFVDQFIPIENNPVADVQLIGGAFSTIDGLVGSDTSNSAARLLAIDPLNAQDSQFETQILQAIEPLSGTDAFLPIDAYTTSDIVAIADGVTFIDTAELVESVPISDIGALQAWGVDALQAVDVFNVVDTSVSTEQNAVNSVIQWSIVLLPIENTLIVSDGINITGVLTETEALTGIDSLLAALQINLTEASTTNDAAFQSAVYIPSDNTLIASDIVQYAELFFPVEPLSAVDVLIAQGGVAFTDNALVVVDTAQNIGVLLPAEPLSVADVLLIQALASWTDSVPIIDASVQSPTYAIVDVSLLLADTLQAVEIYLPVEALVTIEALLAKDNANWTDVLSIADLLNMIQSVPQHVLPVILQAFFRDGVLVATFRDAVTLGSERDGIVIAEYR